MQLDFTEDQIQFREVVSRFLQDKSQTTAVRALMETEAGYDSAVWTQLTSEIGLAGTHLPETYGGFGFGPVELGITAEEMGRYLYCGPFFASAVMAAGAVLIAGDESARNALLPDIAAGTRIAALVLDSLDAPEKVGQMLAVEAGQLNGQAPLVVDAVNADLLVILARTQSGLGLFSVDAENAGITIAPVQSLDATRKLAELSFQDVMVEQIGVVDGTLCASTLVAFETDEPRFMYSLHDDTIEQIRAGELLFLQRRAKQRP